MAIERYIGAEAMSLFVLDAVLWIFGIRGHIPRNDGFPSGRSESFAANTGALMRVLAAVAMSVVFLSLVLWAAVWLAIRLL
ncbi:MAG TPA: hypothetical protein VIJ35_28075 [Bradyrhizobium sp.]